MTALAFTAGALLLGLGAYYGAGAVRRHLRAREDARYRIMLAAGSGPVPPGGTP